jgi:ABC-type transport system involved in cytochrome bd biosynthesis fused ATPase/permease subunit
LSELRRITQLDARAISLAIPTPTLPQSSPQLRSVTLQLAAPALIAFTGLSGSGKSSLLKVLTGVYPLSSGQILYNGFDRQQLSEEQVRANALFLDREALQLSPSLLQGLLQEGLATDGISYVRLLMAELLSSRTGCLLALDDPEQWLPQLGLDLPLADVLLTLARRHLVLLTSREDPTLRLADRLFVLEQGRCRPLPSFQPLRDPAAARPSIHRAGTRR